MLSICRFFLSDDFLKTTKKGLWRKFRDDFLRKEEKKRRKVESDILG